MVTIVVPVFNCHEYLEMCIKSIKRNTFSKRYRVVVVDDASSPPIKASDYEMNNLVVLRSEERLGFPIACNIGMRYSKDDSNYICILNSDVVVTPNWLDRMLVHMNGNIGLVGPCTNNITGKQRKLVKIYNSEEELIASSEEFHYANVGNKELYHKLVGFCLVIKKEVLDKIGLLDEEFSPGNFEDDDLCLRAIEAGYRCAIANDVFIHHFGSKTFESSGINYSELLEINQRKFDEKWSDERYNELSELNNKGGE